MSRKIIIVDSVSKDFSYYNHIGGGLKNMILNPRFIIDFYKKKKFNALCNVSFTIDRGESVAIVGRNGAGKSTLLSLLTGVIKPTKGKIQVNGRVAAMLELGGGFHSELTGRENIIMNATLLGFPLSQTREKLDSIIDFSELGTFIDQPIRTYSSGMLAKLGFSVISNIEPEILIIDEVLAVGDLAFQRKCLKTIKDFQRKGTTTILVSHNPKDVRNFCERTIWLKDKEIVGDGFTSDVLPLYEEYMG
ncbi:TPA: ABC transporter ATP-binding protein [Salmonella enterica]